MLELIVIGAVSIAFFVSEAYHNRPKKLPPRNPEYALFSQRQVAIETLHQLREIKELLQQ